MDVPFKCASNVTCVPTFLNKNPSMNSSKLLFGASYTVCTHCDINSCERKKVVIHDVAHCDLILCYVYAMKVISVKWHQVSHTTDSVLLSWLHCSSPSSASRVPIRPGKSHYICKLLGLLFIISRCLFLCILKAMKSSPLLMWFEILWISRWKLK